jgi:hypothetical protein
MSWAGMDSKPSPLPIIDKAIKELQARGVVAPTHVPWVDP